MSVPPTQRSVSNEGKPRVGQKIQAPAPVLRVTEKDQVVGPAQVKVARSREALRMHFWNAPYLIESLRF